MGRSRSDETTSKHLKLKFTVNANDTPGEIRFMQSGDNGAEIQNKNLNPEFIPLDLPEKKRKRKSWLEKKIQRRW